MSAMSFSKVAHSRDQSFHNRIAELCLKHFSSLPQSVKPRDSEWTVMSCIVVQQEEQFEVVSLGTGSKCIGVDSMSSYGDILNDSHAEVICRRAFLRFLYDDMLQHTNILKFNNETSSFFLNESILFHFFTTHVPCGDATIFSKQNADDFGTVLSSKKTEQNKRKEDNLETNVKKKIKLSEKLAADIHRTGGKCLESDLRQDLHLPGDGYHITGVVRTKPGRGSPTLSVSCSDKLARWCHLGLQGAFLSLLIRTPIYFSTFTIVGGTPYDEEAIKRALLYRLANTQLNDIHKKKIMFGQSDSLFLYSKSAQKSPSCNSIIWWRNNRMKRQVEVAVRGRKQGATRNQGKSAGRSNICKATLFKCFIEVLTKYNIHLEGVTDLESLTYKEAKTCAAVYQGYWATLRKSFGSWTVKDPNLLEFVVD